MVSRWSERGLFAFEFQREDSLAVVAGPARSSELQSLVSAVAEYFKSGFFPFDLDLLDWSNVTKFNQRVLKACCRIPLGTTLTYGQLAKRAGSPLAARAVGAAMARNRWPLLVPCHRVVGSSGKLTGYSGEGGIKTKQLLLQLERQFTQTVQVN
jgi:methylated-DNA-[protein]-cysteine S-methyltransferase